MHLGGHNAPCKRQNLTLECGGTHQLSSDDISQISESPVFWIIVTLNTLNKEMVFKRIWLYVYLDVGFLRNLICYGFSVGRNRCILSIQGLLGYEAGACTVWVHK